MGTIKTAAIAASLALTSGFALAADGGREIGSVDTVWNMMGPNDKLVVKAFDDPKVEGVTCFLTTPKKGGITGAIGLAEEASNTSIACRQTGPIEFKQAIDAGPEGEEVFNESRSLFFKEMHVTRMFDEASGTLIYLSWTDKLIDGSPKNSTSAVTPMPWGTELPGEPKLKR